MHSGESMQFQEEINELIKKIDDLDQYLETVSILRDQKNNLEKIISQTQSGFTFELFKTAINDFIDAYEFCLDAENYLASLNEPIAKEFSQYVNPISIYLKQGIEIAGIEQFTPKLGDEYISITGCDMTTQDYTNNNELIGLISKVHKSGWQTNSSFSETTNQSIIRNAQVSVYIDANQDPQKSSPLPNQTEHQTTNNDKKLNRDDKKTLQNWLHGIFCHHYNR
tara:strand:+ start:159 stop:830 length:672 start_codon:yes stop_codon:yes gene_type:complete